MKRLISFEAFAAIILLILTVIVIGLQIYYSGSNSTKLETSLFSVLQFILSLGFSWLLARITLQSEFKKSQKNFAIAAYRRILEINNAIERLINRVNSHMKNSGPELSHELDVISEVTLGVRESIQSSVADWADIIGEEIEKINRIQKLKEQKFEQTSQIKDLDSGQSIDKILSQLNEQINGLESSLPATLRFTTDKVFEESFSEKLY